MYKVLLVDDEPFILEGLVEIIPWDDYNLEVVGTALNGIEAWECIKDGGVDVLITDIKMPKLDGVGLLKRIRGENIPIKCIVLSGYSDFEYVKESARLGIENYLIKPINLEECRATLDEIVHKLDLESRNKAILTVGQSTLYENTILRWMFNSIDDRELIEHGELLELRLKGGFRAAVLHWQSKDLGTDANTTQQLVAFCKNKIDCESLGYAIAQPLCRIFMLFHASDKETSLHNTSAILESISADIFEQYHVRAMATIGDYQESFRDVGVSMRHAHDMVDYRYLTPERNVLVYERYLLYQEQFPKFMPQFLDKLQDLLTISLNREEILSYLETLSSTVSPESAIKDTHLYSMCILTIMQIIQAVSLFQPNAVCRLEYEKEHIADIYNLSDFNDILIWTKNTVNRILDIAEEVRGNYSKPILRIISFVELNYSQEINLKTIAGEFEMSPLYLGQLFSNEVGEHFTDYLNKYRIEQAKRLLKQDISSKQVAQQVGYSNWNYFYTVFKKHVGSSPNELKMKMQTPNT